MIAIANNIITNNVITNNIITNNLVSKRFFIKRKEAGGEPASWVVARTVVRARRLFRLEEFAPGGEALVGGEGEDVDCCFGAVPLGGERDGYGFVGVAGAQGDELRLLQRFFDDEGVELVRGLLAWAEAFALAGEGEGAIFGGERRAEVGGGQPSVGADDFAVVRGGFQLVGDGDAPCVCLDEGVVGGELCRPGGEADEDDFVEEAVEFLQQVPAVALFLLR